MSGLCPLFSYINLSTIYVHRIYYYSLAHQNELNPMKTDLNSLEHLGMMSEKHFQMMNYCYCLMAVALEQNTAVVEVGKSVFLTVVLPLQTADYKICLVRYSYSLFLHCRSCYTHYSVEGYSTNYYSDKPLVEFLYDSLQQVDYGVPQSDLIGIVFCWT